MLAYKDKPTFSEMASEQKSPSVALQWYVGLQLRIHFIIDEYVAYFFNNQVIYYIYRPRYCRFQCWSNSSSKSQAIP